MSDYTKSTNFAAKDALASGNAAKVVKGTEIDTEFNNIATAIATKTDDSSAAITGGTIDGTAIGGTTPAAGAFTTLSASGAASFADGTASAPAITNTGDTNTGIFFPAADTIAFAEGGVEAMRLDSSGNMGLGVTPSAWSSSGNLQIKGSGLDGGIASANQYLVIGANGYYNSGWKYITSSQSATLYQQTTGQHQWYTAASGTAGNAITFTQAMTLDASGNLGVGTTSPAQKLDVSGQALVTNLYLRSDDSDVSWGAGSGSRPLIRGNTTNNTLQFFTASSERARIDSSGNLLVGTTGNGGRVYIKGADSTSSNYALNVENSNGNTMLRIRNDYQAVIYGAYNSTTASAANVNVDSTGVLARSTSALKYKQDVRDLEVIDISKFRPVRYKSKCENDDQTKDHFGVIADEVDAAGITELVNYGPDGEVEGFQYERLTVVLLKKLQDQQAIIETLTNRITALEAK